jgi:hypothetical protein
VKTIEIIVDTQGKTTVQTRGFAGSSCAEASKFLEEALGRRRSEAHTAEFYHTETAAQLHQQRQ